MMKRISTLVLVTFAIVVVLYLTLHKGNLKDKPLHTEKVEQLNDETSVNDGVSTTVPMNDEANVDTVQFTPLKNQDQADIGILGCLPDVFVDKEVYTERINQYLQSLEASISDASPLYYALYAPLKKEQTRLDLLIDYQDRYKENPLVSAGIIANCVNAEDERCNVELIDDLISADANNGAIWVNAISFYSAKGDDLRVIDAIKALEKTAFFNERFGERVLQYAQALAGSSANNFNMNAIAGIGKAVPDLLAYSPITKWCEMGVTDPEKAQACVTLGEQLATRSKTKMGQVIGLSIQSTVYKSHGNIDGFQLSKQQANDLLTSQQDRSESQAASIMLMLDERLLRSYLKNIDIYGEPQSHLLMAEEAVALYQDNDNMLCSLMYNILDSL